MDSEFGKDFADFAVESDLRMAGEIPALTDYVLASLATLWGQRLWVQAVFDWWF